MALQTRFAATPAEWVRNEQQLQAQQSDGIGEASASATPPRSIDGIAAAALAAALRSPEFILVALAPDELVALRDELLRRKKNESKSATIRDLWHARGGTRFVAASHLYTFVLQDAVDASG